MESLRPLHKARFADILDYGIFLYKKHFKKIFILNLILNIPFMLFIAIANPMFTGNYQNLLNPQSAVEADPAGMISSIFSLYAVLFIYLAINAIYALTLKNLLDGSIIKIIYADAVLGESRTLKQVVRECMKQFGTLIVGSIFYMLIIGAVIIAGYIIVLAGVFIATFAILGISSTSMVSPWITIILSIIGILAAILVMFFFALIICFFIGKYWMYLPAICIEQKKAGTSMERCNKIGKNSFYLIGLTYLFAYFIVFLFPGVINSVISFVNLATGNMDIDIMKMGVIITQLISSILQPLVTCILTALYITLRVKREGLDMEIDLWEIKKEKAAKERRWTAEVQNS